MSSPTALHRPERLPRKDAVDATPVAVLPERSPAVTANNDAIPAHMGESGNPLGLERFRIFPGEAGGVKEGLQRWRVSSPELPLELRGCAEQRQSRAPRAADRIDRGARPNQERRTVSLVAGAASRESISGSANRTRATCPATCYT
jgi:hypothetical protein